MMNNAIHLLIFVHFNNLVNLKTDIIKILTNNIEHYYLSYTSFFIL